jgi:hypothetical protein
MSWNSITATVSSAPRQFGIIWLLIYHLLPRQFRSRNSISESQLGFLIRFFSGAVLIRIFRDWVWVMRDIFHDDLFMSAVLNKNFDV